MSENWEALMMRTWRDRIAVLLLMVAIAGQIWWAQPARDGTRALIDAADRICPALAAMQHNRITVASGAHRLDIAVLRRGTDAVTAGTRCKAPHVYRAIR